MNQAVQAAQKSVDSGESKRNANEVPDNSALLRLQLATMAQTEYEAAALAFCSELADITDALRVSLGCLSRAKLDVLAVTHGESENLDRALHKEIAAAMTEAIEQNCTLRVPAAPGARQIVRANETLGRHHQGAVVSMPIAVHQRVIAALTLEFAPAGRDLSAEIALAEEAATLLGSFFAVLRANERGWAARARDGIGALTRNWPRLLRRPIVWLGIVSLMLLVVMAVVPLGYTVTATARIEGAVQRVVTAPSNGILKLQRVRAGDPVKQGQVLAEMHDRDLLNERAKLQLEAQQHQNAYSAAMVRSERTAMALHQSKLAQTRAQHDLIEQQLAQAQLLSPIDGIVVQGDLDALVGLPIEKGQVLLTVAPSNAYRVIVELDERDIRAVKTGQTAWIALPALPWDSVPVVIERLSPMAVVINGRNVFELQARPLENTTALRPGLRGVARVQVGRLPLLVIWTQRAFERVRLSLWRWWP